jgi:hypothetical protein
MYAGGRQSTVSGVVLPAGKSIMLTKRHIYRLVNDYIGGSGGYLGDFSYRTHREFYPQYCDLEIDPSNLTGTTRERFIRILETASAREQSKIIRGVLQKYPLLSFLEDERPGKAIVLRELEELAARLESASAVELVDLKPLSEAVSRAIKDAAILLRERGNASGIDRIHTALHGFLRAIAREANLAVPEDASITALFTALRRGHTAFARQGARQADVDRIGNALAQILDALNPIRNRASGAHPNEQVLDEPEAALAIDAARSILNYVELKLARRSGVHGTDAVLCRAS